MTEPSEFLSDADVQVLTGYKRPKYQAQWCETNNVDYKINSRGRLVISRAEVRGRELRSGTRNIPREPNFAAI